MCLLSIFKLIWYPWKCVENEKSKKKEKVPLLDSNF